LTCMLMPVFGNEMSAVWARIYEQTDSTEAKIAVMQNMIDLHSKDMEPVISDALKEIVYAGSMDRTYNEQQNYNTLSRMIIRELGSLRAVDSAPDMYKVVQDTDDEFLRATAIVGIGTAGARDYADEIAGYLDYLNQGIIVIENNEQRESVVDACVLALERLKAPVGFKPVFMASIGKHSRDSIARAKRSLQNMVEDPTDIICDILKADSTFQARYAAIGVERDSAAPSERKAEAASVALEVGLVYNAVLPIEKQFQKRTRKEAARMIRDLGVGDESAIPWLDQMLNSSDDVNETIDAIQALGSYTSDSAVDVLNTYLNYHNERRVSGIPYKDERAIRECINSLAKTGNTKANQSLSMVEYSNWSSQTIRMAKNAMKNIN
ncbi:MAG: hypothetical protein PQJ46_13100, partial [Spirochaetales bacterium]|nr:hypothetical protein [Spirochaetales bacterium]